MRKHSREEWLERARLKMLWYTKHTMPHFKVNWHHVVLCNYLDRFVAGDIKRLMIFIQPQIGKSELVSRRLPSLILGRDPDHRIISTSYGHTYAATFNRDNQRIIESEAYQELFPGTRLPSMGGGEGWVQNTDMFEIVGRDGKYNCTGVGGSLTGKTANTLIIDDPVKNQQEADSQTYRDHVYDWFNSTASTRLRPSKSGMAPRVLLTMTRWHEADLAGRLLEDAKKNPKADQWEVVSFPAIKEEGGHPLDPRNIGDALWPEIFSLDDMEKKKAGPQRTWTALYQQRPAPESGNIIQRSWFKYYEVMPTEFDEVIQSWDLTFIESANSDFVVGVVLGKKGANIYLLDLVRARASFTTTIEMIVALRGKWKQTGAVLIERAANGAAALDVLSDKIPGLITIKPTTSKLVRAQAIAPTIEAGNFFIPDPAIAPWVNDYVEEWMSFPNGKNDDQVDATTQGVIRLQDSIDFDWAPVSMTKESAWR